MIAFFLLVIIAVLLIGAARIRGCAVQVIALLAIAYLYTELMDRLSGVAEWMLWTGGLGLLGVLVALSYLPPPRPRKRQPAPGSPKSMDDYLARQRRRKTEKSALPSRDDQKPDNPAQ